MKAIDKLQSANNQGKFICVGLDSDINKIPSILHKEESPLLSFNKRIIDATADHAAAFKINFAFYEKEGVKGFEILEETINYIPKDVLIIGDAKRGDIGNTSKMYSDAIFNKFNCDASTLHPYMGSDSIAPFLDDPDKLNFILALTSNPGAEDFEKLKLQNGKYLFQAVIEKVKEWNKKGNCGIVFGATKKEELREFFDDFENLPVLLPGVGTQGGSLEDVVNIFLEKGRKDYLVNISRAIIYKDNSDEFAFFAKEELVNLNRTVQKLMK
jgi:orotidine-5'-phosphate decarboxylase